MSVESRKATCRIVEEYLRNQGRMLVEAMKGICGIKEGRLPMLGMALVMAGSIALGPVECGGGRAAASDAKVGRKVEKSFRM